MKINLYFRCVIVIGVGEEDGHIGGVNEGDTWRQAHLKFG